MWGTMARKTDAMSERLGQLFTPAKQEDRCDNCDRYDNCVGRNQMPDRLKRIPPPQSGASSDNSRACQSQKQGPLKCRQVYRGRPDTPTRSQGGSADRSVKERGGYVPPRKAQGEALGRWDLAR
jgi:hypothetical protein